jgi:hypothetical protein
MIRKVGKKFVLFSKNGTRKLGTFGTHKDALARENQINRVKHNKLRGKR